MYNLKNDYSNGCHPNILKRLSETNLSTQEGYGNDDYSTEAREVLLNKIENQSAKIFFAAGGTQANLLVIDCLLESHEAVISASTGHIFCHEAGAIEATGHKIISIEAKDGKLEPDGVEKVLRNHALRPHMVHPKLVYISNSTELGTYYTKNELNQLSRLCKKHEMFLYMDGARLGNALSAKGNDLTLGDVSELTDVFSIGGTKNGGMFGEAIVFNQPSLCVHFDFLLKQKGALFAKSRFFGIQFIEFFKEGLYFNLSKRANLMAVKLAQRLKEMGIKFLLEPETNQIFPIFPNDLIEKLQSKNLFYVWKSMDNGHSTIRLITSWNTQDREIDLFIEEIRGLIGIPG